MDYTELVRIGQQNNYSDARNLASEMGRLIARAQDYIEKRLDHDAFEEELPVEIITSSGVLEKSVVFAGTDLFELRGVHLQKGSGYIPLLPRDYDTLLALYSSGGIGVPRHYAETNSQIVVFPRPSRDMNLKITANVRPVMLDEDNLTNVLTDKYPTVIENAVNREVAIFMLDEVLEAKFTGLVGEELVSANAAIKRRSRNETSARPTETSNIQGV